MGRHSIRGKHQRLGHRAPRAPRDLTRTAQPRGRFARPLSALVAVGALAAMTLPLGAEAAPLHSPHARVRLPAAVESLQPYVPQDSCDPTAKPGVVAFRALMLATYHRGTDGGIVRACADGATSEHKEGRAWDWMLNSHNPGDRAVAVSVLSFLTRPGPHGELGWNARRFGIMYIIWDGKIWGAYRAAEGWRPYVGVSEHTDHIHFSFGWAGAEKRTSWWTGHVAAVDYGPCPAGPGRAAPRYHGFNPTACPADGRVEIPLAVWVGPWQQGSRVLALQRALGIRPSSGLYGPRTAHAVALWQLHHGLPHTGVVDLRTAVAMHLARAPAPPGLPYAGPGERGPHVLTLQRLLHVHLSGYYGAVTAHAVALWQLHHGLPHTGIADLRTARAMHLVR